jgi:hypothetical protein
MIVPVPPPAANEQHECASAATAGTRGATGAEPGRLEFVRRGRPGAPARTSSASAGTSGTTGTEPGSPEYVGGSPDTPARPGASDGGGTASGPGRPSSLPSGAYDHLPLTWSSTFGGRLAAAAGESCRAWS